MGERTTPCINRSSTLALFILPLPSRWISLVNNAGAVVQDTAHSMLLSASAESRLKCQPGPVPTLSTVQASDPCTTAFFLLFQKMLSPFVPVRCTKLSNCHRSDNMANTVTWKRGLVLICFGVAVQKNEQSCADGADEQSTLRERLPGRGLAESRIY